MNKTEKLVLESVDKDIADHFSDGDFALNIPMQIHICRYLKKITEQLSSVSKNCGGD
jgi:hypothetical protein